VKPTYTNGPRSENESHSVSPTYGLSNLASNMFSPQFEDKDQSQHHFIQDLPLKEQFFDGCALSQRIILSSL